MFILIYIYILYINHGLTCVNHGGVTFGILAGVKIPREGFQAGKASKLYICPSHRKAFLGRASKIVQDDWENMGK